MTRYLAAANLDHRGRGALGLALTSFEAQSLRGDTHVAIVSEVLREPLWMFRRRITDRHSTFESEHLALLKPYVWNLLDGLDHMHTQFNVIHTGKNVISFHI
jgi:hypothetical protein